MSVYREYYHRHLPHWQPQGATFFVTFCLKGAWPHEVNELLLEESKRDTVGEIMPLGKRGKQDFLDGRHSFSRLVSFMDKAESGPRWLSQGNIANIVKDALHYLDSRTYDLHAYCIMSNHVHVVFTPLARKSDTKSDLDYQPLSKIMQSLKRHTARKANIALGREGPFWQDENYDHVVRDNTEYLRIIHYVLENPVKVGLVSKWEDWPWSYVSSSVL